MEVDRTLKIKEKYFNAILRLEKPFELRHFYLPPNSIVRLDCIDNKLIDTGRYLVFKSGNCKLLNNDYDCYYLWSSQYKTLLCGYNEGQSIYRFRKDHAEIELEDWYSDGGAHYCFDWYDKFCWEYINKAPTYLIEIDEILECK